MARLLVARILATAIVVGTWTAALLSLDRMATYGLFTVPLAGQPYQSRIVRGTDFPVPLPTGVRDGDRLDHRAMSPADRMAWIYGVPAPGDTLQVPLQRDGKVLRVQVTAVTPAPGPFLWYVIALRAVYAAMGLMLLWRGRDWSAWGLAMWALGYTVKDALGTLPGMPATASFAIDTSFRVVRDLGLFVAARHLAGAALPARFRTMSTWIVVSLVSAVVLLRSVAYFGFAYGAWLVSWTTIVSARLIDTTVLACAVVLAVGYAHAAAHQRLRIRWVLAACIFLMMSFMFWPVQYPGPVLQLVQTLLTVSAAGCFLYGILRHHLVDLSFVVSRTLVYATVLALVVGTFAIIEHAIAARALGQGAGLVLHLLVPLVLGVVLHRLLARVEHVIEQLFFRRQFAAERALRRLAEESAYMEDPDALVARTLDDVATHARSARVALYRRVEGGYARIAQWGGPDWPSRIDADDRLFVALRASPVEQALAGCQGALGDAGMAFPMPVAGQLHGALVCGERAERFTGDERTALRMVAQHVGVALHALQARADAVLLDGLVQGTVTLDAVRGRRGVANIVSPLREKGPPQRGVVPVLPSVEDTGTAGPG